MEIEVSPIRDEDVKKKFNLLINIHKEKIPAAFP